MALFTDKIDLSMRDSRNHILEKYVFDVKKRNVEIKVLPGYEAIINNLITIGPNQTKVFDRKTVGESLTVFIYQKATNLRPLSIPFAAGQHTISLDAQKTAKVRFALVGTAQINIMDYKELARFFDNTLSYEDIEKELIENFRPALSAQMSAAAKTHINSASTDVSIAGDLREIAADGVRNSALRATLMNMGLMISASGIALWLNPIGESAKVIEEINARYNQQALEEFDDAKTEKQRQWDKEDRQMANQHEIDVINAQNTNTQNRNNSNTYNYNGNVPRQEVHVHEKRKAPRYCPICGCKLDEDAKFCPKCGNKVN